MASITEKRLVLFLAVLAAVRVLVFAAAFPFFNNVDEMAHVDLVVRYSHGDVPSSAVETFDEESARLIARFHTPEYLMPPVDFPEGYPPPLWTVDPEVARSTLDARVAQLRARPNHEAHSPPVYYLVAGAVFGAARPLGSGAALYAVRFANAGFVALLVLLAWRLVGETTTDRPDLRLGVPVVLAFLPQDVFYSVNSDVLSPVLGTGLLLLLWRWWKCERLGLLRSAGLGLVVAATFLVKYTNLPLVLLFGLALAAKARSSQARPAVAVAAATSALPVAAWLARNALLVGDLTGTASKIAALGWTRRPVADWLAHPLFTPAGAWTFWDGLVRTLFRGEFVWHLERIADPFTDAFFTFSSTVLLAVAAVALIRERRTTGGLFVARSAAWGLVLAAVAVLALLSIAFEYHDSFYPSTAYPYFTSGRLVAGVLVPWLFLWVDGASILVGGRRRPRRLLVVLAVVGIVLLAAELWTTRAVFSNPFNWYHLP